MKKFTCPYCKAEITYNDDNIPVGSKYEIYCKNCCCKVMFKKIDPNQEGNLIK